MNEESKEALNQFKQRLPVDQFSLEKECVEQPSLYEEIGEWTFSMRAEAKRSKEHLDFIKADLSLKIRKNPETYGLSGKVTEGSIDAVITTSDEYQSAVTTYIETDKLASEASVLLAAVEQRKSMLRDLVRLFIYSYYSSTDNVVNDGNWKQAEEAIIAMRNEKMDENRASLEDEGLVEEE
jgi:hypothetical protein